MAPFAAMLRTKRARKPTRPQTPPSPASFCSPASPPWVQVQTFEDQQREGIRPLKQPSSSRAQLQPQYPPATSNDGAPSHGVGKALQENPLTSHPQPELYRTVTHPLPELPLLLPPRPNQLRLSGTPSPTIDVDLGFGLDPLSDMMPLGMLTSTRDDSTNATADLVSSDASPFHSTKAAPLLFSDHRFLFAQPSTNYRPTPSSSQTPKDRERSLPPLPADAEARSSTASGSGPVRRAGPPAPIRIPPHYQSPAPLAPPIEPEQTENLVVEPDESLAKSAPPLPHHQRPPRAIHPPRSDPNPSGTFVRSQSTVFDMSNMVSEALDRSRESGVTTFTHTLPPSSPLTLTDIHASYQTASVEGHELEVDIQLENEDTPGSDGQMLAFSPTLLGIPSLSLFPGSAEFQGSLSIDAGMMRIDSATLPMEFMTMQQPSPLRSARSVGTIPSPGGVEVRAAERAEAPWSALGRLAERFGARGAEAEEAMDGHHHHDGNGINGNNVVLTESPSSSSTNLRISTGTAATERRSPRSSQNHSPALTMGSGSGSRPSSAHPSPSLQAPSHPLQPPQPVSQHVYYHSPSSSTSTSTSASTVSTISSAAHANPILNPHMNPSAGPPVAAPPRAVVSQRRRKLSVMDLAQEDLARIASDGTTRKPDPIPMGGLNPVIERRGSSSTLSVSSQTGEGMIGRHFVANRSPGGSPHYVDTERSPRGSASFRIRSGSEPNIGATAGESVGGEESIRKSVLRKKSSAGLSPSSMWITTPAPSPPAAAADSPMGAVSPVTTPVNDSASSNGTVTTPAMRVYSPSPPSALGRSRTRSGSAASSLASASVSRPHTPAATASPRTRPAPPLPSMPGSLVRSPSMPALVYHSMSVTTPPTAPAVPPLPDMGSSPSQVPANSNPTPSPYFPPNALPTVPLSRRPSRATGPRPLSPVASERDTAITPVSASTPSTATTLLSSFPHPPQHTVRRMSFSKPPRAAPVPPLALQPASASASPSVRTGALPPSAAAIILPLSVQNKNPGSRPAITPTPYTRDRSASDASPLHRTQFRFQGHPPSSSILSRMNSGRSASISDPSYTPAGLAVGEPEHRAPSSAGGSISSSSLAQTASSLVGWMQGSIGVRRPSDRSLRDRQTFYEKSKDKDTSLKTPAPQSMARSAPSNPPKMFLNLRDGGAGGSGKSKERRDVISMFPQTPRSFSTISASVDEAHGPGILLTYNMNGNEPEETVGRRESSAGPSTMQVQQQQAHSRVRAGSVAAAAGVAAGGSIAPRKTPAPSEVTTVPPLKVQVPPPTTSASSSPARLSPRAPRFDNPPVRWKGLTLDAAKWTFTSEELQDIVGKAIRQSAEASAIRLLAPKVLDTELVEEGYHLEMQRDDIKAKYKFLVRRRGLLMRSLELYVDGSDVAAAKRLTAELAEVAHSCDQLCEELFRVTDQLAQIQHLKDCHATSALSMALRKLNTSFIRTKGEVIDLQLQIAMLEAEREEAWGIAESVERELFFLKTKNGLSTTGWSDDATDSSSRNIRSPARSSFRAPGSGRSSRVSIARLKTSYRTSTGKGSLRPSSSRRSARSSVSSIKYNQNRGSFGPFAGASSSACGSNIGDAPLVPPVPALPSMAPSSAHERMGFSRPVSMVATPSTESASRRMRQAQEQLFDMLGIPWEADIGSPTSRPSSALQMRQRAYSNPLSPTGAAYFPLSAPPEKRHSTSSSIARRESAMANTGHDMLEQPQLIAAMLSLPSAYD